MSDIDEEISTRHLRDRVGVGIHDCISRGYPTLKKQHTLEVGTPEHQDHLRKIWRQQHKTHEAESVKWAERGYQYPPPAYSPFPEELRDLTCGAKTRAGTPCKRRDLFRSGRCKLHGGLSTGPKGASGRPDTSHLEP